MDSLRYAICLHTHFSSLFPGFTAMNTKASLSLIALILCAATHTSAWAQSGTITFQGRIVAPVCSGTAIIEQSQADTPQRPTYSMDNSGCENNHNLVASTRLANDVPAPHALVHSQQRDTAQADVEPVLTITYH